MAGQSIPIFFDYLIEGRRRAAASLPLREPGDSTCAVLRENGVVRVPTPPLPHWETRSSHLHLLPPRWEELEEARTAGSQIHVDSGLRDKQVMGWAGSQTGEARICCSFGDSMSAKHFRGC